MKKIRLFSFAIALIVLVSGTFFLINNDMKKSTDTIYLSSTSQMYEIKGIDDLVKYSDIVIIGTILDNEEISTYETKNELQTGKQYLLFLGYFNSPLYPREVYSSIDKDSILEITNGKLISQNKYGEKGQAIESIIESIEKSPSKTYSNNRIYNVKNEYDSIDSLIEASDYIVKISINEINDVNKYVSSIRGNVIQQYKGDIGKREEFLVPAGLEIGKEYLLFLKVVENEYINLSSRKGSIISKDDLDSWNKAISLLNY